MPRFGGFVNPIEADGAAIRCDWRENEDCAMRRRRGVVGLSIFSAVAMGAIALYQTGLLKRPPEPKWGAFDAARVNGSEQAYSLLATPDALLGLASYAMTAFLAGAGGSDRAHRFPPIPIAMGLKTLADAAIAGKLAWNEKTKFKAYCQVCLLVSSATLVNVGLAFPEACEAWRFMTKGSRR
jgi:uncharacterized membrane protein